MKLSWRIFSLNTGKNDYHGIARRIVEQRPFHTTTELAEAIAKTVPRQYRYGRIHPATRVFR